MLVYFAKDIEEWFYSGKFLMFFCHMSASCLSFNIKYK